MLSIHNVEAAPPNCNTVFSETVCSVLGTRHLGFGWTADKIYSLEAVGV